MNQSQNQTQNQSRLKTSAPSTEAGAVPPLLEPWLRLCAGNGELLANYDPSFALRATEGALRAEEWQGFFDWCRETFERLGWDKVEEAEAEYSPQTEAETESRSFDRTDRITAFQD